MQNSESFAVEWWSVDRVIPYPGNPRVITEASVDKAAASIKEFGWRQPIVVDRDGVIVVGHTRRRAAIKLGLITVPVHVATDLTPEQIRAYRLADNRVGEESRWDAKLLGIELKALDELKFDFQPIGFDEGELPEFIGGIESLAPPPPSYQEQYGVIIICADEAEQRCTYEEMKKRGLNCRVVAT